MNPTTLCHIVVSSNQPSADLLLSVEAERQVSAAGNGRSEERAEAIPSRLQTLVRQACVGTLLLGLSPEVSRRYR